MAAHERHDYREDCSECQIILLDETGAKLVDDHPHTITARRIWNASPLEERRACNRVWVHNSRELNDLQKMARLCARIEQALKGAAESAS